MNEAMIQRRLDEAEQRLLEIQRAPAGTPLPPRPDWLQPRHGGSGFPWGEQWLWGFEFLTVEGAASFRLHRAALSTGHTTYGSIVNDGGFGASRLRATIDISAVVEGEWGLAVELDWDSGTAYFGSALALFTSEDAMQTQDEQTETSSPYRIPVAWFSGRTLLRDHVHGMLYPQVWVEPA